MPNIQSLVLYKNQPAVVRALADGKLTIEYCAALPSPGGKKAAFSTQKVREKDIIPLHGGPAQKETLTELLAMRLTEKDAEDCVSPLYDLISGDKGMSGGVTFDDLCDIAGAESAAERWKLLTALRDTPYFSRPQQESLTFQPRTRGEIAGIKKRSEAKGREELLRQEFMSRLRQRRLDLPDDAQLMQDVEALALGTTDKSRTMREAGLAETQAAAHRLLLETGIWSAHRNPYPTRHGLSARSATEHPASPPDEERETLAHTAYAIDNDWSADPDDAIAFDGEFVWVHVADPASSVRPDSPADIAARNRGATLYLPEGAARMLSEDSLEDYALGLSPSLSRALSFKIALGDDGSIADCEVLKSLVRVERLTYSQVDGRKDSAELSPLFGIAERNRRRREKAGAVFIELPEVHVTAAGGKVEIKPVERTESADVVREFMLLAGEAAARFAFRNGIPFPFVGQDKPDIPNELPDGLAGQYRLRRCMRGRSVGVTPARHAGLGLGMYSQVTSPLRRYGDLVAHQQLRAFMDGRPMLDKDQVLERTAAGDAAAGAAVKAERESVLHWTLVFLLENPGWTGEAVAVDTRGRHTVLLIPSLAMETTLIPSRPLRPNERTTVRAGSISLAELSVAFIEAE